MQIWNGEEIYQFTQPWAQLINLEGMGNIEVSPAKLKSDCTKCNEHAAVCHGGWHYAAFFFTVPEEMHMNCKSDVVQYYTGYVYGILWDVTSTFWARTPATW